MHVHVATWKGKELMKLLRAFLIKCIKEFTAEPMLAHYSKCSKKIAEQMMAHLFTGSKHPKLIFGKCTLRQWYVCPGELTRRFLTKLMACLLQLL
jgi:hypothetical protein